MTAAGLLKQLETEVKYNEAETKKIIQAVRVWITLGSLAIGYVFGILMFVLFQGAGFWSLLWPVWSALCVPVLLLQGLMELLFNPLPSGGNQAMIVIPALILLFTAPLPFIGYCMVGPWLGPERARKKKAWGEEAERHRKELDKIRQQATALGYHVTPTATVEELLAELKKKAQEEKAAKAAQAKQP